MFSSNDIKRLVASRQAFDLAEQSILELVKADNPLLSEMSMEILEQVVCINQKLKRICSICNTV